jgi:hypothetical protein
VRRPQSPRLPALVTEVKLGVYVDERTARALQGIVGKRLTGCLTTEWPYGKSRRKAKKRPKRTDPAQFERFIEAARRRGVNESLEDFAVKFVAAEKKARLS